ncbi:MAG: hypothetical protein ABL953_06965 [Ilumatobacteraceae bacterium]
MTRVVLFLAVVPIGLEAAQEATFDRETCYPTCHVSTQKVSQAQTLSVGPPASVTFYGDSRSWFLAEGAKLVPGWLVENKARQACVFLGQDQIFQRYHETSPPFERTVSTQTTGEIVNCDIRTYIETATTIPKKDLAIVYAGTLLTVDVGVQEGAVFSPLNPSWQAYLETNLVATLGRIVATHRSVVVLDTPISRAGWWNDAYDKSGWLWSSAERIAAVDRILARASQRAGATYMTGFAHWVESQPESCHPDGAHLTLECATRAGIWIKNHLP